MKKGGRGCPRDNTKDSKKKGPTLCKKRDKDGAPAAFTKPRPAYNRSSSSAS